MTIGYDGATPVDDPSGPLVNDGMLVVARFREDVSWTRRWPHKIIYNKGDRSTIPDDLQPFVVDLPNVGRESHTFLHHIVTKYDDLDDLTAFSQGEPRDHLAFFGWTVDDLFRVPPWLPCSPNVRDTSGWEPPGTYDFRIAEWDGPVTPTPLDECYGQWYERVFDRPFPAHMMGAYAGAVFSVRKQAVRRHPRALYEKLLAEVSGCKNPVAGHFMERTWTKLFADI